MMRESCSPAQLRLQATCRAVQVSDAPAIVQLDAAAGVDIELVCRIALGSGVRVAQADANSRALILYPPIGCSSDHLFSLALAYTNGGKDQARALWEVAALREGRGSSFVLTILQLCAEYASGLIADGDQDGDDGGGGEAAERLWTRFPLFQLADVREVAEAVRVAMRRGEGSLAVQRRGERTLARDRHSQLSDVPADRDGDEDAEFATAAAPPGAHSPGLPPKRLKSEAHAILVEEETEQVMSEVLTGTEVVDSLVTSLPKPRSPAVVHEGEGADPSAVYLMQKDFTIINDSGAFWIRGSPPKLAAVFVKKAIPQHVCERAAAALEGAATHRNMRSKVNGGAPPETGIVGFYDYLNSPVQRKCRETQFTRSNWPVISSDVAPFLTTLNAAYRTAAPVHHKLQAAAAPPHVSLFGTAFSTVTVNRSFRTALHTDAGDFKPGLGAVCVLGGRWRGCHLAIPALQRAFNIQVGDVLFFDTSLPHGNTEPTCETWRRLSVVCYLRTGLTSGRCEEEHRRALHRELCAQRLLRNARVPSTGNAAVNLVAHEPSLPPLLVPSRIASLLSPAQEGALVYCHKRLHRRMGCVVAMSMGLGKTLVALLLAFSHIQASPDSAVLILTPKSVIHHWVSELGKWESHGLQFPRVASADDEEQLHERLLRIEQRNSGVATISGVGGVAAATGALLIINPELLSSVLQRCPSLAAKLVVTDEAHRLGSSRSTFRRLLDKCGTTMRVALTGTPLQNTPEELYQLIQWTNPDSEAVLPQWAFQRHAQAVERYISGDDDAARDSAVAAWGFINNWASAFMFRVKERQLPPLLDFLVVCSQSSLQERVAALLGLNRVGAQMHSDSGEEVPTEAHGGSQGDGKHGHDIDWSTPAPPSPSSPGYSANEHRPFHLSCHLLALLHYACHIAANPSSIFTPPPPPPPPPPPAPPLQTSLFPLDPAGGGLRTTADEAGAASGANPSSPASSSLRPHGHEVAQALLQCAESLEVSATLRAAASRWVAVINASWRSLSARRAAKGAHFDVIEDAKRDLLAELWASSLVTSSPKLCVILSVVVAAASAGEKVLVFTHYRAVQLTLDNLFADLGIAAVAINGEDSISRRRAQIDAFSKNTLHQDAVGAGKRDELTAVRVVAELGKDGFPSSRSIGRPPKSFVPVMLVSARCGSHGIDLTAANHVILCDSWWNPQADQQAIARAYRHSQTRPVHVYRLACAATDFAVVRAHQRKLALFDRIVDNTDSRIARRIQFTSFDSETIAPPPHDETAATVPPPQPSPSPLPAAIEALRGISAAPLASAASDALSRVGAPQAAARAVVPIVRSLTHYSQLVEGGET